MGCTLAIFSQRLLQLVVVDLYQVLLTLQVEADVVGGVHLRVAALHGQILNLFKFDRFLTLGVGAEVHA